MKKFLKTLMTLSAAALAVVGGLYVYRRFFAKDEELDEAFDEDNSVDEEEDDDVSAFHTGEEIFEDEDIPVQEAEDPIPSSAPNSVLKEEEDDEDE